MSTSNVDLQRSGKSDLVCRVETKFGGKLEKQRTLFKVLYHIPSLRIWL